MGAGVTFKNIEVGGRTYYYNGQYFFDDCFIILQGEELNRVAKQYYTDAPYETMSADEVVALVKGMKGCGLFYETQKILQFALSKFVNDIDFLRTVLPIYTSCCREIGQPEQAIATGEGFLPICGGTVALYTSLAAACCDVKDYEKAKKYARIAYAKQGGGQGYKTETSLVFKRITKETGEHFYEDEND